MLSADAAATYPDAHFDWLFIDALHTHEAVLHDLAAWWPKLRPGGLLSGDDYGDMADTAQLKASRYAATFGRVDGEVYRWGVISGVQAFARRVGVPVHVTWLHDCYKYPAWYTVKPWTRPADAPNVGSPRNRCPLPEIRLPTADWAAYHTLVYGDDTNLKPHVAAALHDSASTATMGDPPARFDVLNMTKLLAVSPTARTYAMSMDTLFPRHNGWGPCFDNSCGQHTFVRHLNVHCPLEFAFRLGKYKYGSSSSTLYAPRRNHTWVEATHCGGSEHEASGGAYFYAARGSGLWINLGRTIAFDVHDQAVKHFLGRGCSDASRNEGMWQCNNELNEMARSAASRGYDSVQFLRHCDAKCEQCLHEIVVLNADGSEACPRGIEFRSGAHASKPCTCVPHNSSVGTLLKPFRGHCASCG